MIRLTPELWLHSALDGDSSAIETRELDFNLARRSGVVINRIVGQMTHAPDVTSGFEIIGAMIQEIDVDPDNVDIEFAGADEPDGVVVDSSRVFRQVNHITWDTAAGVTNATQGQLIKSWQNLPMEQRPVSMTNLRHHAVGNAALSFHYHAEVNIDYFIVELSLTEIGILNASRR